SLQAWTRVSSSYAAAGTATHDVELPITLVVSITASSLGGAGCSVSFGNSFHELSCTSGRERGCEQALLSTRLLLALGRFLHRYAELALLPALLWRNRSCIVPESARYVELNYLCHKPVPSSPLESLHRGAGLAMGLQHYMGAGSLPCAVR